VPTSKKALPTIAWKPGAKPDGGHAFALVGYDAHGFILQNSWGSDWGYLGFARFLYDDWLANGDDAWVAVLGAPIAAESPALILSSSRTVPKSAPQLSAGLVNGATADAVADAPNPNIWDTRTAATHTVILGNDGLPDHVTLEDENAAAAIERVCYAMPKAWLTKAKQGGRRVAIYAHGGLNDLTTGLARVKIMGPWFEKNGIYPVFVAWQSGYVDSIKNVIGDLIDGLIREARGRKTASLFEKFSAARDYLIEKAAIIPARPVWSQMKQNAMAASAGEGGMVQVANAVAKLAGDHQDLEVHLIGHSAGAIVLGAFLGRLRDRNLKATTVSLYAPACTVEFANTTYVPAAETGVIDAKRVAIDILSDKRELEDTVGPYAKSLLYLVSRALEPTHKTPILGMEAAWNPALDKNDIFSTPVTGKPNPDVVTWRKNWTKLAGSPQVLDDDRILEQLPNLTVKSAHGAFDNWIGGVERTLARILGLSSPNKLPTRIESLRGF
jgi:pimeloyl-ACP methyl ester carboxylesterase